MKRILLIIALCLSITFVGCKENENDVVGNTILNRINFLSLDRKLSKFDKKLETTDYISILIDIDQNGIKNSQTLRAHKDPFYIEIFDEVNRQFITQENDSFFHYMLLEDGRYDRIYLGDRSKYDQLLDENDNSEDLLETTFSPDKCNVKRKKNVYTIKCYFKDALNEESKEMIEEIFKAYPSPVALLYDSILTMTYTFNKNEIVLDLSVTIEDSSLSDPLNIKLSFKISLSEFPITNPLDGTYDISLPNRVEEVYETYNFGDSVTIRPNELVYLKVKTKKGMIITEAENVFLQLYDMNEKEISESLSKTGRYFNYVIDSFIPVERDGTYYLTIKNNENRAQKVKLYNMEYDTVIAYNKNKIVENPSYDGKIEGKYDFEHFVYTNKSLYRENQSVIITNNGTETMFIYYFDKFNEYFIEIGPKEKFNLTLVPGYNNFFICNDFLSNEIVYPYSYKCDFKILEASVPEEIKEESIPEEFTVKSLESICYYTYIEKGIHSLCTSDFSGDVDIIKICNSDGKLLDNMALSNYSGNYSPHFTILEDGWYYIIINNPRENNFNFIYTKYDYNTIPDKNSPIEMDITGNTSNTGILEGVHDFEYYCIKNENRNTKIYRVTNESNISLCFIMKHDNVGNQHVHEYHVSPGQEFYFRFPTGGINITLFQSYLEVTTEEETNYSFKVSEIENKNSMDKTDTNILEITEEFTENYYIGGYDFPLTYMKLTLKEEGFISFEYQQYIYNSGRIEPILYDSNGIKRTYSSLLEAGDYYVTFKVTSYMSYFKVRYLFAPNEPKDVCVTLKPTTTINNQLQYSGIYNQRFSLKQEIKYHFTLTEKTTIIYDARYILIYTKKGKLAVLDLTKVSDFFIETVALDPGDYYFVTTDEFGVLDHSDMKEIKIAIYEDERNNTLDFSNIQTLPNKTTELELTNFGTKYFKFIISTEGKYFIDVKPYGKIQIFNFEKQYLGNAGVFKTMHFKKGTYYLIVYNVSAQEGKYNVTIQLQK